MEVRPVRHVLAVMPEWDEEVVPQIEATRAAIDDDWWAAYIAQPFTWARFVNWWAARRWVVPRDPRHVEEWRMQR